jgi:hypothetical protein
MRKKLFSFQEAFDALMKGLTCPEALSKLSIGEKQATWLVIETLRSMARNKAVLPVPIGTDVAYVGAEEAAREWQRMLTEVKNVLVHST